ALEGTAEGEDKGKWEHEGRQGAGHERSRRRRQGVAVEGRPRGYRKGQESAPQEGQQPIGGRYWSRAKGREQGGCVDCKKKKAGGLQEKGGHQLWVGCQYHRVRAKEGR
ncbi:hypothetical protein GOP47_0024280, partial [Adiantum capillus-veneris]